MTVHANVQNQHRFYDLSSQVVKAMTTAVGEQLNRFLDETRGREKVLLDAMQSRSDDLRAATKSISGSIEQQQQTEQYVKKLETTVKEYVGSVEWLRALCEKQNPSVIHVNADSIKPPDVIVKSPITVEATQLHNHIETPQVFVDVDMTPVAVAITQAFDKMVGTIEILSNAVETLVAQSTAVAPKSN